MFVVHACAKKPKKVYENAPQFFVHGSVSRTCMYDASSMQIAIDFQTALGHIHTESYVYRYVCMHIDMYVYRYVCMHIDMYECISICVHVYRYVCMYIDMYVCISTCMYVYRYIFSICAP